MLEAILRHPRLYDGPAHGEAAGRLHRRPAARPRPRRRHRRPGSGSADGAGQRLFYPPNVAGWDDTRWLDTSTLPRPLVRSPNTRSRRRRSATARARSARRRRRPARRSCKRALAFWGNPTISRRDARRAARVRRSALATRRDRAGSAESYPPLAPERAAPAASPSPPTSRPADEPLLQRAHALATLAPARRRRGRPRPARDRAGHADAGRHRARPAHVPRCAAPGSRSPSTAASQLALAAFEEGIAAAAAARRSRPVLVSVFLDGGVDSLSVLAPVGRPALPRAAAPARARRRTPAPPFAEDATPALAPVARRRSRRCTARARSRVMPGDRLRPPGPVALHLAPLLGGRRARRRGSRPAGWPLPRPGRRARQPAPGALARRRASRRRSRRRRCRSPRSTRPTDYDFWAPRRLGRGRRTG